MIIDLNVCNYLPIDIVSRTGCKATIIQIIQSIFIVGMYRMIGRQMAYDDRMKCIICCDATGDEKSFISKYLGSTFFTGLHKVHSAYRMVNAGKVSSYRVPTCT
jgi:hypothetical protein